MTISIDKSTAIAVSVSAAILSFGTSLPAKAASFTTFSFTTNVTASPADPTTVLLNDPTSDIRLDSVSFGGNTVNQFELVTGAKILQNSTYTLPDGTTYGILNSGRGPNTANDPLIGEGPSKPVETDADIVGSLGNLNLNSLVVTRESAPTASFEVSFEQAVDTFFFWERGGAPGSAIAGDSDILVEALGETGSVIAAYKILRTNYTKAGYNISTQVAPILNNGPFNIGSIGLRLDGATTKTLRLTSTNNNLGPLGGDNGPDFKVVAAEAVPEPATMLGALLAGGAGYILKRKRAISN